MLNQLKILKSFLSTGKQFHSEETHFVTHSMLSGKQKMIKFLFLRRSIGCGYEKAHCQELYHRQEKQEDAKGAAVNDEKEKKASGGIKSGRRVKLTAPRYVACNSKNQVINTIHQLCKISAKLFFVFTIKPLRCIRFLF